MSKFILPILILLGLPALFAIDQCSGARPVTPGVPHRNAARIGPGVMAGNGSLHYVQEDLATGARVMGLSLHRVYRSDMSYDGPIGYGWTGEYFQAAVVLPDSDDIRWYDAEGYVHNFVDKGGYFVAPPGVYVTATQDGGAVTLTKADGTVLAFTGFGRLASITDRNGNAITLDYDSDCKLTRITDDRGEFWEFEYDGDGRITRLIDRVWETATRNARVIDFDYNVQGLLTELRLPETDRYNDASANRVTWRYTYTESGALHEVFSPNQVANASPAGTEFQYDEKERVVAYRHQHASAWQYVRYPSENLVRHIDPLGVRTDYALDDGHAVSVARYTGFWEVDTTVPLDHGVIVQTAPKLRRTDPDSYTTTHEYSKGHELTRTVHPGGRIEEFVFPDPTKLAREKADDVTGGVITVEDAAWIPGEFIGGFVRMGADKSAYGYFEVVDNSDETITVGGADLQALGWGTGDRFVVWSENPDPLAGGNLLEHRQVSAGDTLTRSWTYEAFYQRVRSEISANSDVTEYVYNYDLTGDPYGVAAGEVVVKRHPQVSVIAPDGAVTTTVLETYYSYNAYGQLETTTDPEGHTELRHYYASGDQRGFLEEVITAWGQLDLTERYEYDKSGLLTGQWPPEAFAAGAIADDFKTSWQVNALSQRWHETGPVFHDASSERVDVYRYFDADGNENATWREYVAADGAAPPAPSDINDPATFSKSAEPMTATWVETARTFDLGGRLLTVTDDESAGAPVETVTRQHEYDTNGRRVLKISPEGNRTAWDYDERGLLLRRTEGDGSVVAGEYEFTYTPDGQVALERTPLGLETTHEYDGFGRRATTVDPAGHYREFDHDANGNRTAERSRDSSDNLLAETRFEFDELDRHVRTSRFAMDSAGDAIGDAWDETWFTVDGRGFVLAESKEGRTWHYEYDSGGRQSGQQDPVGNALSLTVDEGGRVTAADYEDFNTRTASFEHACWEADYDRFGNVLHVRDRRHAGGIDSEVEFEYDSWSRVIRRTDASGVETVFAYDLRSRETKSTENPDGDDENFDRNEHDWDKDDRLVQSRVPEDANGASYQTTVWSYDARGRVVSVARPDGAIETMSYDADGNRTGWTGYGGSAFVQSFDACGRVETRSITPAAAEGGATAESYSYDGLGQLLTATVAEAEIETCVTSWAYNTLGEPDSMTRTLRTPEGDLVGVWTTASEFNEHGEIVAHEYCDESAVEYDRDALGRTSGVGVPAFPQPFVAIEWSGQHRVAHRVNANDTHTEYIFEPGFGGPVHRIAHMREGHVLYAVDRRFDQRAQAVRARRDHAGATGSALEFDALGRINSARLGADLAGALIDDPDLPDTFGHAVTVNSQQPGNRASVIFSDLPGGTIHEEVYTVSGDKLNRYTEVGGFGYAHDASARVTWDESAGAYYRYDYSGRLIAVDDDSDFSSPERVYRYDSEGRRVYEEEHENGVLLTRTALIHTPGRSSSPLEEHILDAAFVEQSSLSYAHGPDHELAGVSVDGSWYWRHTDVDGSLLGMTDMEGRRIVEYDYLPFGTPVRNEVTLDVSDTEVIALEPGVPTADAVRIHISLPALNLNEFSGRELAVSLPNLASGDRYRTTQVLGNGPSFVDAYDPNGAIHEALDSPGGGFTIYASRLPLADAVVGGWEYDALSDVSAFHVTGGGFSPWLIGGWLIPDTDRPGALEIIDVDPSGDWVRVRGDATAVSDLDDHWRAIPPLGVGHDGGFSDYAAERYLYRGLRHTRALRTNGPPEPRMNRRGLHGVLDTRTGRYMVRGEAGAHPYAYHPHERVSVTPAVPGLR